MQSREIKEFQTLRILAALAVILIPAFGLLNQVYYPQLHDPLLYRSISVLLAFFYFSLSFLKVDSLILIYAAQVTLFAISSHALFLVFLNPGSIEMQASGLLTVVAAIAANFQPRFLIIYAVFTGIAVLIGGLEGYLPLHYSAVFLALVAVLTIIAFSRIQTLLQLEEEIQLRKLAEQALEFQLLHDPLTGLANRKYIMMHLENEIDRCRRHAGRLAVLFIDLDRFKWVNDTFGHSFGDELLKNVAHRLRKCTRHSDLVGRQSGDEFIIVLFDQQAESDPAIVANRIIAEFSEPVKIRLELVEIAISTGIACYPESGQTADELLQAADQAMYRAKHSGGRRYFFYK